MREKVLYPDSLHCSWRDSSSLQLIYLPPPWGDCKATAMDSDFFDTYSITACRIDCETRYLMDNCNCRMVHMPGRKAFATCCIKRKPHRANFKRQRERVLLAPQATRPTAPPSCTRNALTQLSVRNRKALFAPALSQPHLTLDGRQFWVKVREAFLHKLNFVHCRFSGGERQRLLRVRDAVQHDPLQQRAVLRQDPQQGLR